MQPTSNDIEQIIRVVMQRLAAAGDLMSGVGSIADTREMDDELVVRDRVITLATLEGKLIGKKKVRVHPRAVVTPAVADELRRFKVELVRDGAKTSPTPTTQTSPNSHSESSLGPVGIATKVAPILVCGSALWFGSLSRHLCPKQATVQPCDDSAAIELLKQHRVRGGSNSIWLTATPFSASVSVAKAACCTAVLLPSLAELNAALDQAQPECLIVDASRTTVAAIGNMVRALLKYNRKTASQG